MRREAVVEASAIGRGHGEEFLRVFGAGRRMERIRVVQERRRRTWVSCGQAPPHAFAATC